MTNIFKLLLFCFLFCACSPKLKVISIHKQVYKPRNKNIYYKDKDFSFKRLKGTWLWSNNKDSLTIEVLPIYKKPFPKYSRYKKNAYYDTAILNLKYIKNGKTVFDTIGEEADKSCFLVSPFVHQTDVFYLKVLCETWKALSYIILNGEEQLFLIRPNGVDEDAILLKKEGEYEIAIPNSIKLNRISY